MLFICLFFQPLTTLLSFSNWSPESIFLFHYDDEFLLSCPALMYDLLLTAIAPPLDTFKGSVLHDPITISLDLLFVVP